MGPDRRLAVAASRQCQRGQRLAVAAPGPGDAAEGRAELDAQGLDARVVRLDLYRRSERPPQRARGRRRAPAARLAALTPGTSRPLACSSHGPSPASGRPWTVNSTAPSASGARCVCTTRPSSGSTSGWWMANPSTARLAGPSASLAAAWASSRKTGPASSTAPCSRWSPSQGVESGRQGGLEDAGPRWRAAGRGERSRRRPCSGRRLAAGRARRGRVDPETPPLEGVRRQGDPPARVGPVHTGPVHRGAGHVELGQSRWTARASRPCRAGGSRGAASPARGARAAPAPPAPGAAPPRGRRGGPGCTGARGPRRSAPARAGGAASSWRRAHRQGAGRRR